MEPGDEEAGSPATTSIEPNLHPDICRDLIRSSAVKCDQILRGSNYTFLVELTLDGKPFEYGVYKPQRGENPLWDFPIGTLYKRERAAYLLSEALGWHFVPPTVIWDGPYGEGSLQLFIRDAHTTHYFDLRDTHPEQVKPIAVFDLMVNNTDRKGGHCIKDPGGKVWGIDHGLTFSVESKLRTVIWDFGGEKIAKDTLAPIARELARFYNPEGLATILHPLLGSDEIDSLARRMQDVLQDPVFPILRSRYEVPWPLV